MLLLNFLRLPLPPYFGEWDAVDTPYKGRWLGLSFHIKINLSFTSPGSCVVLGNVAVAPFPGTYITPIIIKYHGAGVGSPR